MLELPSSQDRVLRICGIDPGSDTLGISFVEFDLETGKVALVESQTYSGTSLSRAQPWLSLIHGERTARLWSHEQNLLRLFKIHEPHMLVSESPFLGRFPQAFAALVECITAIRRAVWMYDPLMPLIQVDPPTVKLVVGVRAKGSDKDDVKQGLLKLEWLENPNGIDISSLDEHSVDSIVVALSKVKPLRNAMLKIGDSDEDRRSTVPGRRTRARKFRVGRARRRRG